MRFNYKLDENSISICQYTGSTYQLVSSENIKVFPCGRRGPAEEPSIIDPESRLSTEKNNTIRSMAASFNNSFVNSWSVDVAKSVLTVANTYQYIRACKIIFVVNGYHFELNYNLVLYDEDDEDNIYTGGSEKLPEDETFSEDELRSIAINQFCTYLLPENERDQPPLYKTTVYATIKTKEAYINISNTNGITTPILSHVVDDNDLDAQNYLDIPLEDPETKTTKLYFSGLGFSVAQEALTLSSDSFALPLAEFTGIGGTNEWRLLSGGVLSATVAENVDASFTLKINTHQRRREYPIVEGFLIYERESNTNNIHVAGMYGSINDLIIPATISINEESYNVTKVKSRAFYQNSNIKTVTIESSGTTIEEEAFAECQNLIRLTIPENITLEDYAFRDCINLNEIIEVKSENPDGDS